jgi:OOP family OmpA-OmpF porin
MTRILTLLLGLTFFQFASAQDEETANKPDETYQWASIVKEYSSQKDVKQYSAEQALGRPNVLPSSGEHPCAWMPSKEANKDGEILRVRFAKPIFAQQVIVCESYNPGSVAKIYFINTAKGRALVWKNDSPARMDVRKNVITHVLKKPHPTKVQEVEIHLNTEAVAGFNAIDAIGISESDVPYEVSINEIEDAFIGEPENMGNAINSAYQDFLPQISPDGNELYFARQQHPENTGTPDAMDIWRSKGQNGTKWTNAEKMPAPLNDANHNFVYTITPDGNNLLMGPVYEDDFALSPISMSYKIVEGWSEPQPVKIKEYYNKSSYNEFFLGSSKKFYE